ncbi:MAG: hypothetical protein JW749_06550 [Sedimentisphaerales bacterium]|nr:hypothetical protein [Sedimentisphaerales bacterium]
MITKNKPLSRVKIKKFGVVLPAYLRLAGAGEPKRREELRVVIDGVIVSKNAGMV